MTYKTNDSPTEFVLTVNVYDEPKEEPAGSGTSDREEKFLKTFKARFSELEIVRIEQIDPIVDFTWNL